MRFTFCWNPSPNRFTGGPRIAILAPHQPRPKINRAATARRSSRVSSPSRFFALHRSSCLPRCTRSLVAATAPDHDQFRVAVYIPVFVVQKMKDPAYLQKSWDDLSSQVKVDKVYIETYRSGTIADDANLEAGESLLRLPPCADSGRHRLRRPGRHCGLPMPR